MSRIASAAVVLGLVTVLAGGASTPARSSPGTPAATFKACLVTDPGGINDKSFNELAWRGMQEAVRADGHIEISYLQSMSTGDYTTNIDAFIAQKCGIIVTVGFLMADATESAAKAHPKRKFAIVDCSYSEECLAGPKVKNIDQLVYNTVQDGFLGGYLAAGLSKTHRVATFGGENFGTVTIYMDGFWDGVQYYNAQHHAHVKVLGWSEKTQRGSFIENFTNLIAAQKLTARFIREGADVIFPIAGGADQGTSKAVRNADAAGRNVAIEWPDTDGCFSFPKYCKYLLTSVTKGIAESVKTVMLADARGTFKRIYTGTLANDGVALSPYHDFAARVPARLRAELARVKAKIISGQIVPATRSPV
jgi:basic membrane protein A